ncbi:MAG: hypothetical protein AAGG07_09515 [Planctomycetota bacterium]
MSAIAYLERSWGGDRLDTVRLLRSDGETDRWTRPGDEQRPEPDDFSDAARWIADGDDSLDLLILDADGALCVWMDEVAGDEHVLDAMLRTGLDDEHAGAASPLLALGGDFESPGGATAATLSPPTGGATRAAVLGLPDAGPKLLLDELDARGSRPERVSTIWHAMAEAWDPGARKPRRDESAERVVAEATPMTAVIAIDPRGRLLWTWSLGGEVVAAGRARVKTSSHEDEAWPVLRAPDAARLATEWVAWSMQLTRTPDRIVLVASDHPAGEGLSVMEFGAEVSTRWEGCPVDARAEDDPVASTLERLAGRSNTQTPTGDLTSLSGRAGRAHRGVYRWSALAILAAAGWMGVWGWRVGATTGELRDRADAERGRARELAQGYDPGSVLSGSSVLFLQSELSRLKRAQVAPERDEPIMPVMQELEAISLVIGNSYTEVRVISLDPVRGSMDLSFFGDEEIGMTSLEVFEEIRESLRNVSGSSMTWTGRLDDRRPNDEVTEASFSGTWVIPGEDG